MVNVNVLYTNRSAAKRFVNSCENSFKKEVHKVSNAIIASGNTKIVTLCGPTCSGKTTTASILTADLESKGKRAKVLSIDDFYYDIEEMKARKITNFEAVEAIDIEYFASVISSLIKGEPVVLPIFDFSDKKRKFADEYVPADNDVYIIEGIQAMYPEVSEILKKHNTKSIFISVAKDVNICGTEFHKNEIRLMRRVVRDNFYRNSTASNTMVLWKNVRENEEINIYPYSNKADYIIDSLLPYEVFVIGKYFLELTNEYSISDYGYSLIMSLRERIKNLSASCITSDLVPEDSVFREFII